MSGQYVISSALSQEKWGTAHNLAQGIKTDMVTLQHLPNSETNILFYNNFYSNTRLKNSCKLSVAYIISFTYLRHLQTWKKIIVK